MSIRFEDSDHKNQEIEAANSGGRGITRVISRDRVARMLSLQGRIVAMCAPSGLGRDWAEAGHREESVLILKAEGKYLTLQRP
jgi:hypothetical protein